ncbi:MAG: hypothetical protein GXP05_06810 [Alphaproteobacteria bacterium]|nr:hypothetical protein [Alphaproteobacteria bacterium]
MYETIEIFPNVPSDVHREGDPFMSPLQIVIAVTNVEVLSNGELRLLEGLLSDPRYQITSLIECGPRPNLPFPMRLIALLEAPLASPEFGFPTPEWLSAKNKLPVLRPGAAKPDTRKTDVVIDFTGSDAVIDLVPDAAHGIWRLSSYQPFAGFHEARKGTHTTQVDLTRQKTAVQAPKVIASTEYGTKFLAMRNTAFVREKSVQLIERELARISIGGTQTAAPLTTQAPIVPRMADILRYWQRVGRELLKRGRNAIRERRGQRPGMFEIRVGYGSPLDFDPATATPVNLPDKSFGADPFLFRYTDELYLFFEEFDYVRGLGHLSVGRVIGTEVEVIGPALKTEYHLSYPFIFCHEGEVLMMPETHQSGQLEIWRATEFPMNWELKTTALEGVALADSVLLQHAAQWWLFTNISNDSFGDMCSELHLFQVDGPELNQLTPHPLNPVVINSTTARGGGRVFQHDGKLLRASQNNSAGTYGYGLNIMEITTLNMTEYRERIVRRITPDFESGLIGCHHIDFDKEVFAIDVRKEKA